MQSPTSSLFEGEMREQVAAAEAAVLEALRTGDPILVESARGHLNDLINLAHRNGLEITTLIPAERDMSTEITLEPAIDITEEPAAS